MLEKRRQDEAEDCAEGDPQHRERHSLQDGFAELIDRKEVGRQKPDDHPTKFGPGVERRDLDIGQDQAEKRQSDEPEARPDRWRVQGANHAPGVSPL